VPGLQNKAGCGEDGGQVANDFGEGGGGHEKTGGL
jgi:hypothetical protein